MSNSLLEQPAPRPARWKKNTLGLIIALLIPLSLGGIGALANNSSSSAWYQTLTKPSWNPPGWVFGPVWTTLYILMGLASWLIWRKRNDHQPEIQQALGWYSIQLFFNGIWSFIFFGMQYIHLALVNIVLLWSTLLITILHFFRIQRAAAGLLVPYFLWVTFATVLNATIWWLNRGDK